MIKLAANLSFLFAELPFLDRFEAAAAAGFTAVEFMFPYEFDADQIARRLDQHRLQLALFNLPAGDWAAGERGIACLPGRELEFRDGVARALPLAKKFGVCRLNALAGIPPAGANEVACRQTMVANLRHAATAAAAVGVKILVEPINSRIDMPGFWLDTPRKALAVIDLAGHPNLYLQYDLYHAWVMGDDVLKDIPDLLPRIAHLQLADHPGRHQPGSGELPWPAIFGLLEAAAYTGFIGCEYRPSGRTSDSFEWARQWLATDRPAAQ